MNNTNVDVNTGVINWHDLVAREAEDHTYSKIGKGFYDGLRGCGHITSQSSCRSFGVDANFAAGLTCEQGKIKIDGRNTLRCYR